MIRLEDRKIIIPRSFQIGAKVEWMGQRQSNWIQYGRIVNGPFERHYCRRRSWSVDWSRYVSECLESVLKVVN
jgi:hypothetical protein